MGVDGCLACDLADGRRELPGGVLLDTGAWLDVVQPVTRAQLDASRLHGPRLQVARVDAGDEPPRAVGAAA